MLIPVRQLYHMIMQKFIIVSVIFIMLTGCASTKHAPCPVKSMNHPFTQSLDMRGKTITTYILFEVVSKLKGMNEGDILQILTDNNPAIQHDMAAWLRMTGTALHASDKDDCQFLYYIKKSKPTHLKNKSLALVISNPGLEELLSPLGFALGAGLAGIQVDIIFQGPGVRILEKGFSEKLGGFSRPFTFFARKGLNDIGHVPAQEKLRQLKELGARFYACGPSMDHFNVKAEHMIFSDVIIAEYLSFIEVMDKADIHFFLQ